MFILCKIPAAKAASDQLALNALRKVWRYDTAHIVSIINSEQCGDCCIVMIISFAMLLNINTLLHTICGRLMSRIQHEYAPIFPLLLALQYTLGELFK